MIEKFINGKTSRSMGIVKTFEKVESNLKE